MKLFIRALVAWLTGIGKERLASCTDSATAIDASEVDHMRSWSISAQLAAVPPAWENEVHDQLASLIRAAKDLHPEMAAGAQARQAESIHIGLGSRKASWPQS